MKLIIDIDEKLYEQAIKDAKIGYGGSDVWIAVGNGIPLPEGHGRLIDETKITKYEQVGLIMKDGNITRCFATDAPTIVEAEKR